MTCAWRYRVFDMWDLLQFYTYHITASEKQSDFMHFQIVHYYATFFVCVMHQMSTKWMRSGEVLLVRRHVSSPGYESVCMNLMCGFHTKSCRKRLFFATNFSISSLFYTEVPNVYNFYNVTPAWREPLLNWNTSDLITVRRIIFDSVTFSALCISW